MTNNFALTQVKRELSIVQKYLIADGVDSTVLSLRYCVSD